MLKIILGSLCLVGSLALAEEKTCVVSGVHCQDCVDTVKAKVCDPAKYSSCDVKLTDKKQQLGKVHLVTKDSKDKVDEKAVGELVKDAGGYTLEKCSNGGKA